MKMVICREQIIYGIGYSINTLRQTIGKERVFSCKCPKVSYYMTSLSVLTQPQPALTIENWPSSWNDPLFQILIYCIFLIVHMYIYIYNINYICNKY